MKDREYFFIDEMRRITYVVKTRKPYGYRFYWLSHKQHPPIRTQDCKPGHEFEIKTDNTSGHGTLPPSRHRDDVSFHYQAIGQNKISIQDKLYDGILKVLADCLKPQKQNHSKPNDDTDEEEKSVYLTDNDIRTICDLIKPQYKKGLRHNICYTLSGVLHKSAVHIDCAISLLQLLTNDDEEASNRIRNLNDTYKKNRKEVSGYNAFYTTLQSATDDSSTAKNILHTIDKLLINKMASDDEDVGYSPLERLRQQFTFKTIRETEKVYYYDETQGRYRDLGETVIKEHLEILCQTISTHGVNEIINKIKRRTYVKATEFDNYPDMLNLKNGLLNIITCEFSSHTSTYLSLVQLPINYDVKARCPKILRFLGQVLGPKDVFTILEVIGYCLHKTARYEKAFLFVGDGDNGKGTLLKLLEYFLGPENVCHTSLQDLDSDRFAKADLYGKLANICGDLQSKRLTNTGNFKMLVSGDTVRAQRKHAQPFDFRNNSKLIFSTNEIPKSDDNTYAYFKRWLIFSFERIFQGETKDTNLIAKLTTEEELSGLLNLALIALKQLIKDSEFRHADHIETTKRRYNQNASSVDGFLTHKCYMDKTDRCCYSISTNLYRCYVLHCEENNIIPVADNVFGSHLAAIGIRKERKLVNGGRSYCYIGITSLQ